MAHFYHDHSTLEEFVRHLARATEYRSYDTGDVIDTYWRAEAEEWVKELDARLTPTLPVSAASPAQIAAREDLLRILTRYEGAVQRAQDEIGEYAADRELTEAREDLMRILQQARVTIEG